MYCQLKFKDNKELKFCAFLKPAGNLPYFENPNYLKVD